MTSPVRIANCSGFFGDRLSAAREMVDDGPIDVLTGDWLAELTMLILARRRAKRPGGGFASTFVTQMEHVMGSCLDRGIKVVANAGGLDPDGCAEAVADVADKLGLSPTIAYVSGDDLMSRAADLVASGSLTRFSAESPELGDPSAFLTANAYLGCWGIVDALDRGADIVVCGRVTDAAVACGPAAWWHQWVRTDLDQLAGAVVAGHVIECSAQATGGNYSFFTEVPGLDRVGYPWAEVAADGSSVIGKHDGTGGQVSIGTVTSQLLYEIGAPRYLGPDVTARFDTITLAEVGADRVLVSGVKGEPPPETLKVGINKLGGFRGEVSIALTGLDIDEKAAAASAAFWAACPFGREDYDSVVERVERTDKVDPASNQEAAAVWRLVVKDSDEHKVGRPFSGAMIETALASIPGLYSPGGGPNNGGPFGVFTPALVPSELVPQYVSIVGGDTTEIVSVIDADPASEVEPTAGPSGEVPGEPTTSTALGAVMGARSGDKGGDANLGVFTRTDASWLWLDAFLSTERLRELLPEVRDFQIDRHPLPNLRAINFVIHGLLEEGVAASTRRDAQAKSLGEWLRARIVDVPSGLIDP